MSRGNNRPEMASNESLIMKHHWWHFNAAAAQLWTMTTQKIESDLTLSSVRGGGGIHPNLVVVLEIVNCFD